MRMPRWRDEVQQFINRWSYVTLSDTTDYPRVSTISYQESSGNNVLVHPEDYHSLWFTGGAWYPDFYAWANDADDLTRNGSFGNASVNLCRAIRDEAYALDNEWNIRNRGYTAPGPLAHWERELLELSEETPSNQVGIPNNINEGGAMPETGTQNVDTIEIEQSPYARYNAFDSLGLRDQLMNELNIENWERVMGQLREATAPILHQIVRGSFEVGNPAAYVAGRPTRVDYLSINSVSAVVDSASDGKIELIPLENQDNYYTIAPRNALDRAGFRSYAGQPEMYSELQGDQRLIYVRDLRNAMAMYSDYRANRRTYVTAAMRENMINSARQRTPERPIELTRDRAVKLDEFIKNVQKNTKVEANPLALIPILPHKTISSRRWGIEIEHPDIHGVKTPQHWELHGDGSLRGREYEDEDSHDSDCLWYEDEPCDCGYADRAVDFENRPSVTGEWNSPILHSFHSRGLKFLMEQLEGRYENDTAGVHVHVEAADLTPEQAVRLTMIYTALEPLFQSEYHREVRNYCKSVDLSELINRFNQMRELKGRKSTEFQFHSRYWTVNMAALNAHGTIEFRAMGPVYEYEHLIRWAAFCREMVNIARADVPQKVWSKVHTFKDLLVVFSKYGKETPTPKWAENEPLDFDEVLSHLGTENRRLPNARPSNAYSPYGSAPLEVFDDYYGKVPEKEAVEVYNL
jgi:hypothetical protein